MAVVLFLGSYAYIALNGPQGVSALVEKRRQIREMQEVNASMAADNQRKRERIQRLKTSTAEQELEIRERLKLIRPGETQFILPDSPGTGTGSGSTSSK